MANTSPGCRKQQKRMNHSDWISAKQCNRFFERDEFYLQKQFSETPMYGRLSISYSDAQFTALDEFPASSSDQRWKLNLSNGIYL